MGTKTNKKLIDQFMKLYVELYETFPNLSLVKRYSIEMLVSKSEEMRRLLAKKRFFKTEEGIAYKANMEAAREKWLEIYDKLLKNMSSTIKETYNLVGWNVEVFVSYRRMEIVFTAPNNINRFNLTIELTKDNHVNNISVNYPTNGSFVWEPNGDNVKYLMTMGTILSDEEFKYDLTQMVENTMSQIDIVNNSIDEIDSNLNL